MIAMAIGQALLAIAFSWVASTSLPTSRDEFHATVELPLWFAILPAMIASGVSVHLWSSRHVDRACPWANLGWLILAVNIFALMLFMLIYR